MSVKRRNLSDLYVRGKVVKFDDGAVETDPETGEEVSLPPVEVYLRKLNDIETEKTTRRANAAKAQVLMARRDPESDEYLGAVSEIERIGDRDDWVAYVAETEVMKDAMKIEAELSTEDEWAKDDYLQGLYDAWTDHLSAKHFTEPDEESERVWSELQRYNSELQKLIEEKKQDYVEEFSSFNDEKLRERMLKYIIDRQADYAWVKALRRAEVFIACRDPEDKKTPYFKDISEVEELPNELFLRLVSEYQSLAVDVLEGKGLPPTQGSSPPSDQREVAEVEVTSGPQDAVL